ncbi:MAG: hypothetical protein ABJZ83_14340 [Yoonia sp.]|uniref:hypothetical protein n=1 Tax=Yoonia sp. TaxID=2212373 RepID=UPI0032658EAF
MNNIAVLLLVTYLVTTPFKLILIWSVMWFLNRFTAVSVVILFGVIASIYHVQSIYRGLQLCDDPDGWVNRPELPSIVNWIISVRDCDPPLGGAFDWVYFYITGPLTVVVIIAFVVVFVLRSRSKTPLYN